MLMPLQRKAPERISARYRRLGTCNLPLKSRMPSLRDKLASVGRKLPRLCERYLVDGAKGNVRLLAIQAESEAPGFATCRTNPEEQAAAIGKPIVLLARSSILHLQNRQRHAEYTEIIEQPKGTRRGTQKTSAWMRLDGTA